MSSMHFRGWQMDAAGGLFEDVVTEGRGEAAKFIVHVITGAAVTRLCDALVVKPATPEPDIRNSIKLDKPPVVIPPAEPPARLKALQDLCPPGQFYNLNTRLCVGLQVTPNCPPGQTYESGQCVLDIAAPTKPRCAEWENYNIITDTCEMPNRSTQACTWPQFYSALEQKCVSQIAAHATGVSCRADQLEFYGTCVPIH
jgi:hypothetical protein